MAWTRYPRSVLDDALRGRGLGPMQARLLAKAVLSALFLAIEEWRENGPRLRVDAGALKGLALLRKDLDGIGGGEEAGSPSLPLATQSRIKG